MSKIELLMNNTELTQEQFNKVTSYLVNGLLVDGAHHKQYNLEQALLILCGETWVNNKKRELASGNYYWEEGIP